MQWLRKIPFNGFTVNYYVASYSYKIEKLHPSHKTKEHLILVIYGKLAIKRNSLVYFVKTGILFSFLVSWEVVSIFRFSITWEC